MDGRFLRLSQLFLIAVFFQQKRKLRFKIGVAALSVGFRPWFSSTYDDGPDILLGSPDAEP
jgi:hypothetical protein